MNVLCPLLICHFYQVWYWYLYALFWDAILVRFYVNVFIPYFEMPFLSGFILMLLCLILRYHSFRCHSSQVLYWCLYALFWDAILVRFDIDVLMPFFEMPFLSGLIFMSLCPLLRCNSCQVWYWCLYALFWDAILVRFYIDVFMSCIEKPFLSICAPLFADLFLYSYETDFIQGLPKKNEKKLARSFHFTFRYIDDVFSLNNSRFGDFVDRIYPIELEIKDTTYTDRSASYIDLHLEFNSEGRLRTKLCHNRGGFNFPIVNFPFICSNIPAAPAYGVYISQLIRYSRACGSYQDFLDRGFC